MINGARIFAIRAGTTAFLALTLITIPGNPAYAAFDDSDGDSVIDTIERVAGSDPTNPNSIPEVYLGIPACTDGIDNDLDGFIDDADPACTDSDSDLVDDPTEIAFGSDPNDFDSIPEDSRIDAILVSLGFITFQCNDGLDNDLDGLIDDGDPGCDPFDTDADGFGDVEEKTYGSDPNDAVSQPEDDRVDPSLCADDLDNDGDSLTDIEDDGCREHPTATPTPPEETPTVEPTATSTPSKVIGLPPTGSGPSQGGGRIVVGLAAAALIGALTISFAAASGPRRRSA